MCCVLRIALFTLFLFQTFRVALFWFLQIRATLLAHARGEPYNSELLEVEKQNV